MADEPKDNRPDVEVRSKARKNSNEVEWYLEIQHEAVCRFGCGSFHTPDVNQVIIWAVEHEASEGHKLAKDERLGLQHESPLERYRRMEPR